MSQDASFTKTFVGVLAVLVGISVVLFFIARSFGGDADNGAAGDPRVQAAIKERIQPFGTVQKGEAGAQQAAAAGPRSGADIVKNTCAACHASGTLGAPVIGEKGAWAPRLNQGADALLQNATQGIRAMPPKGGDASLSEAELKAAIGHMLTESGLKDPYGGAKAAAQAPAAKPAAGGSGGGDLAKGKQVYQQACFACHGTGAAGAPKVGDAGAWKDRIAQGKDTLYQHAINGFQGSAGFMPAKGGNPALSDEQVKAAVDYLVAEAK